MPKSFSPGDTGRDWPGALGNNHYVRSAGITFDGSPGAVNQGECRVPGAGCRVPGVEFGVRSVILLTPASDQAIRGGRFRRVMFKAFVSPLPPAELLGKIQTLSNPDDVEPASPTLFPGTQPVVGRVSAANQFVWQRRPAAPWLLWLFSPACWFRPFLMGTVRSRDHGSELRLEGGASILAKVLWALAFAGVATFGGIVTVFSYPANISHDPAHSASRFLAGLVLTGLVQGLLLLPPLIGWFLTRHDLQFMAEHLEKPLALKPISYRDLAPE